MNITTSEYQILRAVYSREGLQQCDIADLVGKDKAAVCRCVAGLASKGLVTLEQVSHKCLKVYLTEKARDIKSQIIKVAEMRHKALSDITTPEELAIFIEILDKIITLK